MSALLKKEIRLLVPVWITAMLLVVAPAAFVSLFHYDRQAIVQLTAGAGILGCTILSSAAFGREFESRTFSLMLVQPRQRREFWRGKITVLIAAVSTVSFALGLLLLLSCKIEMRSVFAALATEPRELVVIFWWLAMTAAVTTGGLWTTLILRQVFGSVVFSIIVPVAIMFSAVTLLGERVSESAGYAIVCSLLIAYAFGGYFLARWLFRTAQDIQWTGGNLSLPNAAKYLRWTSAMPKPGKTHPLRALFAKEFHLHESSLIVVVLLLVAQIAAELLSHFAKNPHASVLGILPTVMWALWLLMPALVGCASVAEERKLGTLEAQLCLPATRARQFAVKVFVALALGATLGVIGPVITAPFNRIEPMHGAELLQFAWWWMLGCMGITIISLYASSLTRYALQAFGVGIAFVALWAFLFNWLNGEFLQRNGYFTLFGLELWRGPVVFFAAAGVMLLFAMGLTWRRWRWLWLVFIALVSLGFYRGTIQSFFERMFSDASHARWETMLFRTIMTLSVVLGPTLLLLALAAKNFKHVQTLKNLWLRNGLTWAGCLVFTIVVTPLVYHRVWEVGMKFEPPAGPPRLSGSIRPMIAKYSRSGWVFTLLPDGRLASVKEYNTVPQSGKWTGRDEAPWKEIPAKNPCPEFIGGSNWISIAASFYDMAGVKSDGSLWSIRWWGIPKSNGEVVTVGATRQARNDEVMRQIAIKVERIGHDSDWKMVAGGSSHFIALKRDGTIWGWGENRNRQLGDAPLLVTNGPVQIGLDSDWTAVFAHSSHSLAVKRDGSVWKWGAFKRPSEERFEINPVRLNVNLHDVRGVISGFDFDLFLDQNGNIAVSGESHFAQRLAASARLSQGLSARGWSAICLLYEIGFAGIKDDGTLWVQPVNESASNPVAVVPGQVSRRSDWIALLTHGETIIALAKDGTLCRFGNKSWSPHLQLLAPTRRVTWNVNLLGVAN